MKKRTKGSSPPSSPKTPNCRSRSRSPTGPQSPRLLRKRNMERERARSKSSSSRKLAFSGSEEGAALSEREAALFSAVFLPLFLFSELVLPRPPAFAEFFPALLPAPPACLLSSDSASRFFLLFPLAVIQTPHAAADTPASPLYTLKIKIRSPLLLV